MTRCFSFTASGDWFFRHSFSNAGLRSISTDLGDGTVMQCWVPKFPTILKPNLLLLHGFGANAMWQYSEFLRYFTPRFNVYVPDLVFFGESYTTRADRMESFQACCVMKLMEVFGVKRMSIVGISYGGFVGYSLASQFPKVLEKLVLCCSGVCLEENDMAEGLFPVKDIDEAANILVPQTPDKLRHLIRFSFVNSKPVRGVPSCFLTDFIDVMCTEYVQEKRELIKAILKDRKFCNLPKIAQKQQTLIIWGEHDQIFPLELGYRLKRHIGESARLVTIENAGHAVNIEKPKEFVKHLKSFLIVDSSLSSSSSPLTLMDLLQSDDL